jgi:hypothetical protein
MKNQHEKTEHIEPFFGAKRRTNAATVMDASKHLAKAVVVGIDPDGRMYVAGTDGAAESVDLCAAGIRYLLSNAIVRS